MVPGEKVAFGTIAQLVLADVPAEELEDIKIMPFMGMKESE